MRKRGLALFFFAVAAYPASAQLTECTLNPYDPQVAAKLAPAGNALELRKPGEGCRLELDCKARAAPARLRYDLATLKGLETPPVASQMTRITFTYADGTSQTCKVLGAKTLK